MTLTEMLRVEGFDDDLLFKLATFRKANPATDDRIPSPKSFYHGPALKKFVAAILAGYNVLLEGAKGVGKNTLIDTAAYILRRPVFQFPFNQSVDASAIVGADTLVEENGHTVVQFRKHQLVEAMEHPEGAWFVGDEINMTRPDVTAVLHMATDYRRELDYPGMGRVKAHAAFRFIGTMNYGYMGTQELNEAFGDRFVVIEVEALSGPQMAGFLVKEHEGLNAKVASQFATLYTALDASAKAGTISSRAVTMRGIDQAISLHAAGLSREDALFMGIVSKAFDPDERRQVRDIIQTTMSETDVWFPVAVETAREALHAPVNATVGSTTISAGRLSIDLSHVAKRR